MPRRILVALVVVAALAALVLGVAVLRGRHTGPSTDSIERMQNSKVQISVVPSGQVGTVAERMLRCIARGRRLHWTQAREMRCAGVKP
jgi:hypothetical protein